MSMKKTVSLRRHALVNMYMFNELAHKRHVTLTEKDKLSLSNMYFISILDFDLNDLAGKKITSATLEMTALNSMESQAVDVSTVSQQWDPQYCNNYFCEKDTKWALGGWFSEVIMSAGHSRYFREKVNYDPPAQKVTINIDPYIINAMAAGQSFGFALMDVKSRFYVEPNDVYKNRMDFDAGPNHPPILTVTYEDVPAPVIAPVNGFYAMPLGLHETEGAAVLLSWECDFLEGTHYRIYMSERDTETAGMSLVPKYMTPNVSESARTAVIEGLSPDTDYSFAIEVTNGVVSSEPKYAKTRTLNDEKLPEFPVWEGGAYPSSENICRNSHFTVSVTDDINKVDPIIGKLIPFGGAVPPMNSGIYNGQCVHLMAAGGEKQAFQLIVTLSGENADFDIQIKGGLADTFAVSKLWCLNKKDAWYPDVAVPLKGSTFSIPFAENKIPGQKSLSLLIDVDVKKMTPAGVYDTEIRLSSSGEEAVIPVAVQVLSADVPRSNFKVELNGYVYLPKCAGYEDNDPRQEAVEQDYYRLGYEHYGTVNILPYNHSGELQENFAPEVGLVNGEMHVTDWSMWDKHFASYLDGSYMEELTGERSPVTHMYLPFNENWPMPMKDYYKVNEVPDGIDYPDNVTWHHRNSNNIYMDFKPGYRDGIKSVLKDFIHHIEEKGWKNVQFQYFFNNKNFYKQKREMGDGTLWGGGLASWLGLHTTPQDGSGTSWWLLDEPHSRIDWEALRFYGTILREAQAETGAGRQIKFRADLSCFNQAFDYLDGILDLNVVGGNFALERQSILRKRRRLYNEDYWPYGGWNGIEENNMNSILWILDVYLQGSGGIIPWYNFGLDLNFEEPDSLAVLCPGRRFGVDGAIPSMRLKAGRRACELIKYMDAFKKAFGYSDKQLMKYVSSFISLKGETAKEDHLDAGKAVYANTQNGLEALKRDMLCKLELRQPTQPPKGKE